MAVTVLGTKRYYKIDSTAPFEEDIAHEFKAHMNICIEEIPHWAYGCNGSQSRAAVSKAICAFLNNEQGGTVYCGILDNGRIQGLCKTQYQLHHLKLSLEDVLGRYNPPVAAGRVSLSYVPAVDQNCTPEMIQQILSFKQKTDPARRSQPHELREKSFKCWCVRDAKAQLANNAEQPLYIIEIIVHPWDASRGRAWGGVGVLQTAPIIQDECGRAYARCQATVIPYSPTDVHALADQMVHQHYAPKIAVLRKELYKLRLAAVPKEQPSQKAT